MTLKRTAAILLAGLAIVPGAFAADLRIGLAEDPDALDPAQSRTLVGRIVFASLCDKLVDITPDLDFTPQLATDWTWSEDGLTLTMDLREGVTFHDGTPFDAEAVVFNIERYKTMDESVRKSELASVETVEAVGELQVAFHLSQSDVTLLAQLSDRSGMMVSPTAAEASGADFAMNPVCAGPFKFVSRVQQDRIVLEKFSDYWNADNILVDGVTFLPIPDGTVRLANLQSGDLDMIERMNATDVAAVKANSDLSFVEITGLGYQGITTNVANGAASETPFGQDARVRQAFSLAIDRDAINQVVFEGTVTPGNQPWPPGSPWYNADFPVQARDVEAAKALLAEVGVDRIPVEILVSTNPTTQQVGQLVQSMVAEAGFDLSLRVLEFATQQQEQTAGSFVMGQLGWSGRVDPDGNLHQFVTCEGGINDSDYCNEEVDTLLNDARTLSDPAARKVKYDAATAILQADLPLIYLYHTAWLYALDGGMTGFVPYPDGMIRLTDVSAAE